MNQYVINEFIAEKITGEWGKEPSVNAIKVIRTTNFTNEGKLNLLNVVERDIDSKIIQKKKLQVGDIIIEKSGGSPAQPVGRVVYFDVKNDENYLCNNFTSILRPSEKINPKYLFFALYYFHLTKKTLAYQNKTTGIINLQLDRYITTEKIPFPSLPEQQRIVDMLNESDSLRSKRKQAIDLLDEYIKAVFIEMFGDPVTNPKKWKKITFKSICSTILGGGTPSKSKPEYYDGIIPWVTPKDMKRRYISNSEDHITDEAIQNSSVKLIPPNSVLMVIRSGILKRKLPVAINTVAVTINQDMKAYLINQETASTFFILIFFEIYQTYLLKKVRSVTADNLNFDDIRNCPVIIPPLELQIKFEQIVKNIENLKQKMQDQSKELDNQFQALMQESFKN